MNFLINRVARRVTEVLLSPLVLCLAGCLVLVTVGDLFQNANNFSRFDADLAGSFP